MGNKDIPPPNIEPKFEGGPPSWLTGVIERTLFFLIVFAAGAQTSAIFMAAWLALKAAINWQRIESPYPRERHVIIGASQASILASLTSLLFALIGGLIAYYSRDLK